MAAPPRNEEIGIATKPPDRDQRERIRHTAVRLFSRHGYEGTSVKRLAAELGMVPANLYNYFPSKEAILFDVLRHELLTLLERERLICRIPGTATERLGKLVEDLILADLHDPLAAFTAHHGLNGLSPESRKVVSSLMAQIRGLWAAVIEAGIRSREFAVSDVRLAAITVISLASSVAGWFTFDGRATREEVVEFTTVAALAVVRGGGPCPDPQLPR